MLQWINHTIYINKHLNPIPVIKVTINGRHNYFIKHNSSASKPTEIIRKIFLMWHSLTLKVLCSKVIQISHQYIIQAHFVPGVYIYACAFIHHTHIICLRMKLNTWLLKACYTRTSLPSFLITSCSYVTFQGSKTILYTRSYVIFTVMRIGQVTLQSSL